MHAATALAAVSFTCKDLDKSVAFYRALGAALREARHGSAPHWTCALAGVHFALHPDDGVARGAQGGTQISLMVTNLAGVLAAVTAAGGIVVAAAVAKPWGITGLVEDPDGRRV